MNRELFDPPAAIKPAVGLMELAVRINAEHESALSAARASLTHARNAGLLLLEAKKQASHGQWLPWLKANAKFSERTAQAYMRVAKRWPELEAKAQATADLTIEEGLNLLAGPKSEPEPQSFRLPALKPGMRYTCVAQSSRFDEVLVEMDPHPDYPGYWVYTFFFTVGEGGFSEYNGRGVKLDLVWPRILHWHGCEQVTEFHEEPALEDDTPYAIKCYREDFDRLLTATKSPSATDEDHRKFQAFCH